MLSRVPQLLVEFQFCCTVRAFYQSAGLLAFHIGQNHQHLCYLLRMGI